MNDQEKSVLSLSERNRKEILLLKVELEKVKDELATLKSEFIRSEIGRMRP